MQFRIKICCNQKYWWRCVAREHVSRKGTLAREEVGTQSTLALEQIFSTQGRQFSRLALIHVINGQNKQTLQIYNFFWIMHSFPKTGAETCSKRISNMKVYYIIPLNYQLKGHPENLKNKLYYLYLFQERFSFRYIIILKLLPPFLICF